MDHGYTYRADGELYVADCGERGAGVRTRVDIAKGRPITFFDGEVIGKDEAQQLQRAVISLDAMHTCLLGLTAEQMHDGCGMASLVNDLNYTPDGYAAPTRNNARLVARFDRRTCTKTLVLVAARDIAAGEEIGWSYMNVATQAGALAEKRAREHTAGLCGTQKACAVMNVCV